MPIERKMASIDWDSFDLGPFANELRETEGGQEAETTVWAFEQAVRMARVDRGLLNHLLVAVTCLLARAGDTSPREILDAFFRRAVSDEEWRNKYVRLLP